MPDSPVLQPYRLGDLDLKNRVVMAPLTRSRSNPAGVVPDYAADYYAQRSTAGLIVSEATNISPQGKGYEYTPGIWSPEQVEAWSHVTDAVHRADGVIFCQLWHTGRMSHRDVQEGGVLPVSSSAVKPEGQAFTADGMVDYEVPRALETDEVAQVVEDYRHAAQCAKDAGFDGVEIHSANNYLLEQFVRDSVNGREDQYGGSVEDRLRFPLAVADAVVGVWGGGARVGIRLSPATTAGGTPMDSDPVGTYGAYLDGLAKHGLLYVHMIEGQTQGARDAGGLDYAPLRARFAGAYIANNSETLELAEQQLEAGAADLFAFGRPFIANPDLPERLRVGAPLAESPKETWYGGDERGYSDFPTWEEEQQAA